MPGRSFGELVTMTGLSEESSRHTKGRVGSQQRPTSAWRRTASRAGLPGGRHRIEDRAATSTRRRDPRQGARLHLDDRLPRARGEDGRPHPCAGSWARSSSLLRLAAQAPLGDLVVSDVVMWCPTPELMTAFGRDWQVVRDLVRAGRAHEISESHGSTLVAATKGPGGPPSRTQPYSSALARQRAWALKPACLRSVLEDHRSGAHLAYEVTTTLESRVVAALRRFAGRRVVEVEEELAMLPHVRNIERLSCSERLSRRGPARPIVSC